MHNESGDSVKRRKLNNYLILFFYNVKLNSHVKWVSVIGCTLIDSEPRKKDHNNMIKIRLRKLHDNMLKHRKKKPPRNCFPHYPSWRWYSEEHFELLVADVKRQRSENFLNMSFLKPVLCDKRPTGGDLLQLQSCESQTLRKYLDLGATQRKQYIKKTMQIRKQCEENGAKEGLSRLGAYFIYLWNNLKKKPYISCLHYRLCEQNQKHIENLYTTKVNNHPVEWVKVVLAYKSQKTTLIRKDKMKVEHSRLEQEFRKYTQTLIDTMSFQLTDAKNKVLIFKPNEWRKITLIENLSVKNLNSPVNDRRSMNTITSKLPVSIEKITILQSKLPTYSHVKIGDVFYSFREKKGDRICSWNQMNYTLKNMKHKKKFTKQFELLPIVFDFRKRRTWYFVPKENVKQYERHIRKSLANRCLNMVSLECEIANKQLILCKNDQFATEINQSSFDSASALLTYSGLFNGNHEIMSWSEVEELMDDKYHYHLEC